MDAVGERTADERCDSHSELLLEVRDREPNDSVDDDPPSIRSRTILGGSVQHAAMDEGRPRGPGRSHVRLNGIQGVGFPGTSQGRGVPQEEVEVLPRILIRAGEPPSAFVEEDRAVERRDALEQGGGLFPSDREHSIAR